MMILYALLFALVFGGATTANAATVSRNLAITVTSSGGGGDPTVGVLPSANDAYANWQNAGLQKIGGIPNRTTQCGATVNPTGVTPPASNDDAHAINTAIANCTAGAGTAGQVVQLGIGTFQLDNGENINLTKSITLRGTGTCNNSSSPYCQTVISVYNGAWPTYNGTECGSTTALPPNGTPPTPVACPFTFCSVICIQPAALLGQNAGWAGCQQGSGNPTTSNCGATIAVDAAKGDTKVQVSSTANFSVGQWVMLDENPQLVSTVNPVGGGQANINASPEFLSNSPTPVTFRVANPDVNCNYSLCTDRLNQDIHLVTAVGTACPGAGCTLTFDSPLTMAFRQSGSHDARVYWLTLAGSTTPVAFLQQAGVENITIERSTNGSALMQFCAYCWLKNIESAYWIKGTGAVYSARVQFTGSYFHDCVDCTNDGAEYPVAIDTGTTEALVDNNITRLGGKGMVGRTSNTAVVAYNYIDDQRYSPNGIGDWFLDMSVNGTHNAGTHHFLFEGNYGSNCDGDETHGSAFYHVFFRNQCAGLRATFVDAANCNATVNDAAGIAWTGCGSPNSPGATRAAGPMAFNYWYAFVGNVLGLAGTTTSANGWVYYRCANSGCTQSEVNKTIWESGWTGSEWNYNGDKNIDGTTGAYIFRHGNYDYVTPGIADWTVGFSQALPNSFYLSGRPSFFGPGASCTYPWPWVTSNGTSQVQTNSCSGSGLPAKARYDAGTPFVQP
jgi:hypothetical protein